jgi:hypothetical protein
MGHVPQVSQQKASPWEARAVPLGPPPLWFITRDSDFATVHAGKMILNAALYQELAGLLVPRAVSSTLLCNDHQITEEPKHLF